MAGRCSQVAATRRVCSDRRHVSPNGDGRLAIEVGGLLAGVQFDRLTVSGRATLEGILAVKGINGFVPASGNSFAVLTYGSRSGTFALVNGGDTMYTIDYGAQETKLSVL
jgi:outer membrane autotransporter protein